MNMLKKFAQEDNFMVEAGEIEFVEALRAMSVGLNWRV